MIGQPIQQPTAIYFWLPALVVIAGNVLAFFYCQIKKDNSYIDVLWSLTFITPVVSLIILRAAENVVICPRIWLILACLLVWGLRLSIHIGLRHNGEDFRYQDMRKNWMEGGLNSYYIKAFLIVFMMQGLFSLIVNSASLYVCIWSADD